MKKTTLVTKTVLLMLCLCITFLNLFLSLEASELECALEPESGCVREMQRLCQDFCEAEEDVCDYVEFLGGQCLAGICKQYYELYCEKGESFEEECWAFSITCPW